MPAVSSQPEPAPIELVTVIEGFLRGCLRPLAVEDEQAPIRIQPGGYALEVHGKQCVLQVWGDEGNIVRRVVSCARKASADWS